jgi:hypothetical protein
VIRRAALVTAVAIAAALVLAAASAAYWSAAGAGQGIAATGSVGQVTGADTSLHGTIASTSIDVRWSPIAVTPGVAVTYVVERHAGVSRSVVCTTTATVCTLSGLADGSAVYGVTAQVNGWAGAESTPSESVRVSTEAPTTTAMPSSPSADATPSMGFTHPSYGSFRCTLDGSAPAPCSSPVAVAGLGGGSLADGQHTFTVEALDGYAFPTHAAVVAWTVRRDAPALTAAPDPVTQDKAASFAFTHPAYATFRCKLDAAAYVACTSPAAHPNLAVGTHTFRIEAVDGDGVATNVTAYTWTIR